MTFRIAGLLVAATVALAGCGGGGDEQDGGPPRAAADDQAFPVTIEHKRGSTTIESAPQRVVSLGFKDQDFLIALGVMPVATREWFGKKSGALWPWAREAFEGPEPEVLTGEQISFERVAALRPDLITAIYGGLTAGDYKRLSEIAPTVAQPAGVPDYGVSWQDQTRITGEAVGRSQEAERLVSDVEGEFAQAREDNPELQGKAGVYGYVQAEGLGAYPSADPRARFLEDLGLETPAAINEIAGDQFFANISDERIDLLDADVLVMTALTDTVATTRDALVKADPLYGRVGAVEADRDVYPDETAGAAVSFASPLSLPAALDALVPQLKQAVER